MNTQVTKKEMINVINAETGVSKTKLSKYANEELVKLYAEHSKAINERKNAELKAAKAEERKRAELNAALDKQREKDAPKPDLGEGYRTEAAKEAAELAQDVNEVVTALINAAKAGSSVQHIFNEFLRKDADLKIIHDAKGQIEYSMFNEAMLLTRDDGVKILAQATRLGAVMDQLNARAGLKEGEAGRLDSAEYSDAKRNFNNRLRRACKRFKTVADIAYKGSKNKGYAFELKAESTADTFEEALNKLIEKYLNPSDSSGIVKVALDDVGITLLDKAQKAIGLAMVLSLTQAAIDTENAEAEAGEENATGTNG